GHVVRYLEAKLRPGSGACLEQRAFYALRRAAISVLNVPRAAFRPETRWDTVLGSRRRRRTWAILHHATGVVPWPRMRLRFQGASPQWETPPGTLAVTRLLHYKCRAMVGRGRKLRRRLRA